MTYVVARPHQRFEIRESTATPAGPRARTLATFRVLSEDVLDRAASRARRPFNRARVEARAAALGARRVDNAAGRAARDLLAALHRGEPVPPALAGRLREELPAPRRDIPDSIEPVLDWIGTSAAQRGEALRDLLRLTDRIPTRRRAATLSFPGIHPARTQ
jgi:hypothetical protein